MSIPPPSDTCPYGDPAKDTSPVTDDMVRTMAMQGPGHTATPRYDQTVRDIVRTSGPLMLAMSGHTIMMVVDRLCLAAYSQETLAASGPAVFLTMTAVTLFIGITHLGRAVVSQVFAKGGIKAAEREAGRLLAVGAMCAVFFALGMPILVWASTLSARPPEVVRLEQTYLLWAIPFGIVMIFNSIASCYFAAIDRSRQVLFANLVGQAVAIVMTYGLVFGAFGLPEMGMAGSAIGTLLGTLSIAATFVAGTAPISRARFARSFVENLMSDRAGILKRFYRGLPIGGNLSADDAGNTAIMWATSIVGISALEANNFNVILNYVGIIPILGISNGATVLASRAISERDFGRVIEITFASLGFAAVYIAVVTALILTCAQPLTTLFGIKDYGAEVYEMSISITHIIWLYALAFALSFVSSGVLQGFGLNGIVLKWRIAIMWFGSVPAAFAIALAVPPKQTAVLAIWISLSIFELLLGAIFLMHVFRAVRGEVNTLSSVIPAGN